MASKGLIEPDTLTFMADQILAGDKSPYANIGRGAQGAETLRPSAARLCGRRRREDWAVQILAALNAEFAGLTAGERTLGTRTANVEMAAAEITAARPHRLAASNRVDRTRYPVPQQPGFLRSKRALVTRMSFGWQANNGLINTYARAISAIWHTPR
jgi:hypothetical protein